MSVFKSDETLKKQGDSLIITILCAVLVAVLMIAPWVIENADIEWLKNYL